MAPNYLERRLRLCSFSYLTDGTPVELASFNANLRVSAIKSHKRKAWLANPYFSSALSDRVLLSGLLTNTVRRQEDFWRVRSCPSAVALEIACTSPESDLP